jgi:hypothetical protein
VAPRVAVALEVWMLRRFNSALYEAPPGAQIQIVVEGQDNNGVEDARFQYGSDVLPREIILGLPGCSFTVDSSRKRLEAVVVFDPGAAGSARYDMFEVESGVKSALGKSVTNSSSAPLMAFAVDPVAALAAAAPIGMAAAGFARPIAGKAPKQRTAKKKKKTVAKKAAKPKAGKKTAPRKRKTSRKRPK